MLQGHEALMVKVEAEGLRHLVASIRLTYEVAACKCEQESAGMKCSRCFYLGIIDKGLAAIARKKIEG